MNNLPPPTRSTEASAPVPCSALTDAATIPQPSYADLWAAFVQGAKEGQKHPQATNYLLNRAADAYCKLWHLTDNPKSFHAFHGLKQNVPALAQPGQENLTEGNK